MSVEDAHNAPFAPNELTGALQACSKLNYRTCEEVDDIHSTTLKHLSQNCYCHYILYTIT